MLNNVDEILDALSKFPIAIVLAYISYLLALNLFGPGSILFAAVVGALYLVLRYKFFG